LVGKVNKCLTILPSPRKLPSAGSSEDLVCARDGGVNISSDIEEAVLFSKRCSLKLIRGNGSTISTNSGACPIG
jgi:hypothetical protein